MFNKEIKKEIDSLKEEIYSLKEEIRRLKSIISSPSRYELVQKIGNLIILDKEVKCSIIDYYMYWKHKVLTKTQKK